MADNSQRDDRSAGSAGETRSGVAKWATLAVRLVPGLLELTIALAITALIIWLPLRFSHTLEENRKWRAAVPRPTASVLTRVDFGRLVAAGIIGFDRATFGMAHASCDGLAHTDPRRMKDAGGSAGSTGDAGRSGELLNLLCGTAQGKAIREEIAAWNLSFDLLAVRDNRAVNQITDQRTAGSRSATRLCADTDPVLPHYVQRGCFPSAWEARYVLTDGKTPGTALGRAGAMPPTDSFGFLAATPMPYAGDWWLATPNETAPGEMEAGRYLLVSTILTGAEPVVMQLIGDLTAVEIEGANPLRVDDGLVAERTPRRIGAHTFGVRRLCESEEDHTAGEDRVFREELCPKKPPEGEPLAYRIEIRRAQGVTSVAPINLTLSARPIRLKPPGGEDGEPFRLGRTLHLNVRCPAAPGACAITWENPDETKPAVPGSAPVAGICPPQPPPPATNSTATSSTPAKSTSAAGSAASAQRRTRPPAVYDRSCTVPLADGHGVMTDDARVAGLSDVVGLGPAAYRTLSARVADRDPKVGAVRLTIDMNLQRRAQAALDASNACRAATRCQGVDCRSRGMFVVVNASDDDQAGEILAAATCPGSPDGLSAWDLAVLDRSRPGASPIAATAWRVHDVSAMPGSSFKPFTALAAISAALERSDPELRRLLMGVSEADARRLLGISSAAVSADGICRPPVPGERQSPGARDDTFIVKTLDERAVLRCITNVHEARDDGGLSRLGTAVLDPTSTLCRSAIGGAIQIGICEALIKSSNLYFAALASRVDQATIDTQIRNNRVRGPAPAPAPAEARVEGLAFSSVIDRVFAAKRETRPNGRTVERPFPLLSRPDVEVPRLEANIVQLAVERQPIDAIGLLRRDLALNGIGQAVEATPVQMASGYASLATLKIVRPSFVPREGPRGSRGDQLEGQPIIAVPSGKEKEFADLYEGLRRGLKGVPRVGTAAAYVPRIRANSSLLEASFMKTGTATIGRVEGGAALYSAWVAGWVEPVPNAPQLSRRLAFACQVSHTRGFGGTTCGPVVDAFLSGLATAGTPGRSR